MYFAVQKPKDRYTTMGNFFREHRDEVIKMANLDDTWERREELIRAEEDVTVIKEICKQIEKQEKSRTVTTNE